VGVPSYFAVLGQPIDHSLSPRLHGPALREKGGVYLAFEVGPQALPAALDGLFAVGFVGLNITLPLKEEAFRLVADASPTARRIGAVNTLARREGGWYGDNTDAPGFVRSLPGRPFRQALVLGAGGAARAVLAALTEAKVEQVAVSARRLERATALAHRFGARAVPWARRSEVPFDLLVNCTSLGQHPGDMPPMTTFAAADQGALVYDLIYNPPRTTLLRLAEEAGLATQNGLEMLLQQAALSWQSWFGQEGPVERMRRALEDGQEDEGGP
jgi:shikimate dehydrogenase